MASIFTPCGDIVAGVIITYGGGELYKEKIGRRILKQPYKARILTASHYKSLNDLGPWRAFYTLDAAQAYLSKKRA